jgi:hypothetical protein
MHSSAGSRYGSEPTNTPPLSAVDKAGAEATSPVLTPTDAATVTSLAGYLTSLANDQVLRHARAWRRFVRVRTDDLESVRVERAIKRVRSDITTHGTGAGGVGTGVSGGIKDTEVEKLGWDEEDSGLPETDGEDGEETEDQSEVAPEEKDEDGDSVAARENERPASRMSTSTSRAAPAPSSVPTEDLTQPKEKPAERVDEEKQKPEPAEADATIVTLPSDASEDAGVATPVAETHPRIPRSLSAEPVKAARLSRIATSTVASTDGTDTPPASELDDGDSSPSTTPAATAGSSKRDERRKKRTDSVAVTKPAARKSRKVTLDDFEMMRVLGKGCAGKVLLVRHKQSTDLYALKAITKRHVLAHQELQHTLTEQAVLKRMAAEASDPFVVRLWWSFHDKENLFLVMVRVWASRPRGLC